MKKKQYFCATFMRVRAPMGRLITYDFVSRTTRHLGLVASACLILGMLFAPDFSLYARAQALTLGTNVSNAPTISVRSTANVTEGDENFFALDDIYLPTTVYYLPDTAFGPIPYLIQYPSGDTLKAEMTFEDCRMAWRWTVDQTAEPAEKLYFYFSTHETATAEIIPACIPVHTDLPDVSACTSYTWGDTTIFDTGDYTSLFKNTIGCDSTVSLHVTILQPSSSTANVEAYDSLKWLNGNTYYKSIAGPVYITENAAGCDSMITLNLAIRHLNCDTDRITICRSEAPYQWQGQSLRETGLYSTDTIQGKSSNKVYQDTVHSLYLTINETYAVDTFVTICDSMYTWHDSIYVLSGNYTDSLKTMDGCDSIIVLHLTLTDDCYPKEYTCIEALRQIDQTLVINRSMIEDFNSMNIQWMCDGKKIDSDIDRLLLTNRPDGEYSAYLLKRDCPACDTTWICSMVYGAGASKQEQHTMLSVHPTYISAAEPYVYLSTSSGAGKYYLYGPNGKMILLGDFAADKGVQKLTLPAMSGLYVLICLPEGDTNMNHAVQKIKLLVY